jgi:GrpB-like predicted nucleotidyltransferase (UPF0157 family)
MPAYHRYLWLECLHACVPTHVPTYVHMYVHGWVQQSVILNKPMAELEGSF